MQVHIKSGAVIELHAYCVFEDAAVLAVLVLPDVLHHPLTVNSVAKL
jgi:hypothetical protein